MSIKPTRLPHHCSVFQATVMTRRDSVYARIPLRGWCQKFFFSFFCWKCMGWGLNPDLRTDYLLNHDDFALLENMVLKFIIIYYYYLVLLGVLKWLLWADIKSTGPTCNVFWRFHVNRSRLMKTAREECKKCLPIKSFIFHLYP